MPIDISAIYNYFFKKAEELRSEAANHIPECIATRLASVASIFANLPSCTSSLKAKIAAHPYRALALTIVAAGASVFSYQAGKKYMFDKALTDVNEALSNKQAKTALKVLSFILVVPFFIALVAKYSYPSRRTPETLDKQKREDHKGSPIPPSRTPFNDGVSAKSNEENLNATQLKLKDLFQKIDKLDYGNMTDETYDSIESELLEINYDHIKDPIDLHKYYVAARSFYKNKSSNYKSYLKEEMQIQDEIKSIKFAIDSYYILLMCPKNLDQKEKLQTLIKLQEEAILALQKKIISLEDSSLDLKNKTPKIWETIEMHWSNFERSPNVSIAQMLIDLCIEYHNALETLIADNPTNLVNHEKHYRISLSKLALCARFFHDLRPKDCDEGYRLRSEVHVKASLDKQYQANIKQQNEQAQKSRFQFPTHERIQKEILEIKQKEGINETGLFLVGARSVGLSARQGNYRPTMEDAHLMVHSDSSLLNLYGIFDGHNGSAAAQLAKNLFAYKLYIGLILFNAKALTDEGIWKALKWACIKVSKDIKSSGEQSGTTAAICLEINDHLWIANVGDSRVILDNDGEVIQLSEDASPTDEKYAKGVIRRGGFIQDKRINGKLAPGRSLGDAYVGDGVSAAPKITRMPLASIKTNRSHLIIVCDGVCDVANTNQIGGLAHKLIDQNAEYIANAITLSALNARSTDNVSALVIKL